MSGRAPPPSPLVAGVELGGTKCIAVLARGHEIVERVRVPTTDDPAATLDGLSQRIADWNAAHPVAAIGIASFGPLVLDTARADYGRISTTPKPGWRGADVRGHFAGRFAVPIGFDTDVAGAALAEGRWGAATGCDVVVYLTIGTGIGGGVTIGGRPVHGLIHPEIGHLRVRRAPGDDFAGICPFHGDCLEGLASGPAIAARTGRDAAALPPGHPLWDRLAGELAELAALLLLTLSAERILIGGGVGAHSTFLLPRIRTRTAELLGNYLAGIDARALERIILPPALGDDAGPLGAVALALDALAEY